MNSPRPRCSQHLAASKRSREVLISDLVAQHGRVSLYDVRVLPPDRSMIDIALGHDRIMTIEDGTRHGGAGSLMVSVARERAQDLNAPLPTTRILGIPRLLRTSPSR